MSQKLKDPSGRLFKRNPDRLENYSSTGIMIVIVLLMLMTVVWLCTHYAKPIDGASMQPGINNYPSPTGDIAIVANHSNFDRGDIVILDMQNTGVYDSNLAEKLLIKRVIAIEGDSIKFIYEDGQYNVYLKEANTSEFKKLQEDYIKPLTYSGKYEEFNTQNNWVTKLPKNSDGSVTIPVGYYFCMGDNRNDSLDCRNFGPLATTSCIGVVETILYKGNIFNTILTWLAGLNTSEAVIK